MNSKDDVLIKRNIKLSNIEKIIHHLFKLQKFDNQIEVPPDLTQDGIAASIKIARQTVSTLLKTLKKNNWVEEKMCHIHGKSRRKNAYFLTESGTKEAMNLLKAMEATQYIDFADQAPQLRYFFGRDEEINKFEEWLESRSFKTLIISGIAGIGKTTYVTKIIEPYRESKHIFWYRFNKWSNLRSFLTRLGDFLYEIGKKNLSANLRTMENIDVNKITDILAEDLQYLNSLLIFDDYQKVQENDEISQIFGAIHQILEQIEGTKIIITGREVKRSFYDERDITIRKTVKELTLKGLDEKSSLAMLEKRNIIAERGKKLFKMTDGHPLVMELIHYTKELKTQEEVMRFLKDEIYSHLNPEERKILEIASVFRFPIYPSAYLDIAFENLTVDHQEEVPIGLLGIYSNESNNDQKEIRYEIIDSLVNKSLLHKSGDVCDIHDLIRAFVYERLPGKLKKDIHVKVARYYQREITQSSQTIFEILFHYLKAEEYQKVIESLIKTSEQLLADGFSNEILDIIENITIDKFNKDQIPDVLRIKGDICFFNADTEKAIYEYQRALELYRKNKNQINEANVLCRIANLNRLSNNWDIANADYRTVLSILQNIMENDTSTKVNSDNTQLIMRTIMSAKIGIGLILMRTGEYESALVECKEALVISENINDTNSMAVVNMNIGTILVKKGDLEEAIKYLNKAISHYESLDKKLKLTYAYNNLGVAYQKMNEYEKALESHIKTTLLSEEIGYNPSLVHGLVGMAEDHIALGDLDKALECLERGDQISGKLKKRSLIAAMQKSYGMIYGKKGNIDLSKEFFDKALSLTEDKGTISMRGQIHCNYGQMFLENKLKQDALVQFNKSLKIFEKLGNKAEVEFLKEEIKKASL